LWTKDPTDSGYSAQVQVQEASIVGETLCRSVEAEGRNNTARVTIKNMREREGASTYRRPVGSNVLYGGVFVRLCHIDAWSASATITA
jgi:hypothetical protein